jgi:NhaA family Na+:H+ antiporter
MPASPPRRLHHITWIDSDRPFPSRFVRPVLRFTRVESAGGVVLLIAAAAALVWANAPFGESYQRFWETRVSLSVASFHLDESLRLVVNDALMAIFFFVVGLEIKRELATGELRDPKAAALPAIAALGGMIFPALIYLAFTLPGGVGVHGWGVPMATDIAFAVGVVSLLGKRVPVGGKLFLLALAIADDIGAITVIAVFYTDDLNLAFLGAALGGLVLMQLASRVRIRSLAFYVPLGMAVWFMLFESGVHATLAGVAIGLLTPARAMYTDREFHDRSTRIIGRYSADAAMPEGSERIDSDALELAAVARESVSPLDRIEGALLPWSSFVVVPIFALANAGVRFAGVDVAAALTHPVALGVAVGLVAGKIVGISLFTWLAVRFGIAVLPRNTEWRHIFGLAAVGGIGFTVALFVTSLAFDSIELADRAKTGIFLASTVAGIIGYVALRTMKPIPRPEAGS